MLRAEYGYDAFFVYGTLLGAIREGTYIGHDVDFDAAYVSASPPAPRVSQELVQIALTLIEHGLAVTCLPTHLHISDPDEPDLHIDLFHTYFDDRRVLSFPFGVAGTSVVTRGGLAGRTPDPVARRARLGPGQRRAGRRVPLRRRLAAAEARVPLAT